MFNLSENLKALRVSRGFTQEQAAELLGVSKQSVSRWENGVTSPDITLLPALASGGASMPQNVRCTCLFASVAK